MLIVDGWWYTILVYLLSRLELYLAPDTFIQYQGYYIEGWDNTPLYITKDII